MTTVNPETGLVDDPSSLAKASAIAFTRIFLGVMWLFEVTVGHNWKIGGFASGANPLWLGPGAGDGVREGVARAIASVTIDGEVVPTEEYRLDQGRWLVRLAGSDGKNPGWPCRQRLDLPSTEEGTFEIVYTFGVDPPPEGKLAAKTLACQLALACDPGTAGKCKLPERVTTLTRQGDVLGGLAQPSEVLGIDHHIAKVGVLHVHAVAHRLHDRAVALLALGKCLLSPHALSDMHDKRMEKEEIKHRGKKNNKKSRIEDHFEPKGKRP